MNRAWKTKFGMRRVRQDPPTLEEAIFAATGLSGNAREQAEIAASLMDVPLEEAMAAVTKARARRRNVSMIASSGRAGAARAVVVERKSSRRPPADWPISSRS
jgi:hypothetical protein